MDAQRVGRVTHHKKDNRTTTHTVQVVVVVEVLRRESREVGLRRESKTHELQKQQDIYRSEFNRAGR